MSFLLRPLQRLITGSFFSNSDGTTKSDFQAEIEEIEVPVQTKTNADDIKKARSEAIGDIKAKVPQDEPKDVPGIDNIADEANKAIKRANDINKANNTRNTRRSLQKDSSKISNDISEKVADACNNIQKNTRANAARKKASVEGELPTAVIEELKSPPPIASNASEDDDKINKISVGIKKVIKGNIVVDAQQTSVFLSTESKDKLDFNTGPELDVADKSLLKSQTTLDNDNSELVDEIQKPLFDKFTELTDAQETELYNEFIKGVTGPAGAGVDPSILREKIEESVKDVLANMVNTEVKPLTTGILVVGEAKGNVQSVYVRGIQGKGVFCNGFYVKRTEEKVKKTAIGGTISVKYQMETNHNLMICLCHNDDAGDNIYRWKIMTDAHFKGDKGECWAYMECPGEENGCSIAFTHDALEAKGPFTREYVPRGIWSYYSGDDGVWVNNCVSLLFDTSTGTGGMDISINHATDEKMRVNKIVDSLANNVTKFWLKRLSKYNETSITWKVIFKRVELELAAIRAGNVFHHCGRPQPPFLSVPPQPYPKQPMPTPPPPPPPQPTPLTPQQLNNCYPSVIIDSYKFTIGPILDIESFLNRTLIYVTCESIYAAAIAGDAGAEIENAGIDATNPSMIPPPKRIYFWVYLSQSEGMFRVLFMINANSSIEKGIDYTQGTLVHLKLQKILNDYYNTYYKKEGSRPGSSNTYFRTKINSLERFNYFILNMPYIHDDFFHPTLTALPCTGTIPRPNNVEMCEYYVIDKNFTPCITRGLPMNREDYGMNDEDRKTYDNAIDIINYKELGNGKFTHPLIVCFTTVYLKSRPSDMVILLDSFYYTDTVWIQGARNCTALYNILSPVLYISMGAHLLFPDYELSRYRREIYGVASARWGDDTFKRWSSLELLISDHPQYNMYLPIKEQRTASKVASERNSKLLGELAKLLDNEEEDELEIDPTYLPIVPKDSSDAVPSRRSSAKTASSSSSSSSFKVGETTAGRELVKDRVDIDAISSSDLLIENYFALLIDPTSGTSPLLPNEWRGNVNLFNEALNNPAYNMTDFLANLKAVATTPHKQEPFKRELSELQQIILKKYYLYGMFDNSYHMCNGFLGGNSELYYLSNDGDFVECSNSDILNPSSPELYTFISKFDNNRKLNYKAGSPTLRVSVHTFAQFYAMKFKYFETIIKDTNGDYPEKDMYMIFQVSSTIVYDDNYKILYAIDKQKTPIACLPDLNVGPPDVLPPSDMESMVTLIGTFKRYSAWGAFFASKMMEYLFDTFIQLPVFFSKFYDILQVCDTYCTTAPFFNFCDKSMPYSLLKIIEAFSFSDVIYKHMTTITGPNTPYKVLPVNFKVYLERKLTEHTHLIKLFTDVFMAPFMNLNDPDYATVDSGSSYESSMVASQPESLGESDFSSREASQVSLGVENYDSSPTRSMVADEEGGTIVKHNTPIVTRPPILKHKSKSHLRNTMKMLFKPKQPHKSKIIFSDTSDNSDDIGGAINPIGGHPGKYNKLRTTRRL